MWAEDGGDCWMTKVGWALRGYLDIFGERHPTYPCESMEHVLRRFRRWSRWWALGDFKASPSLCFGLRNWQVRGKRLASFNYSRFIWTRHPLWVRLKWLNLRLAAVCAWQGGRAYLYRGLYSKAIVDRSVPNEVTWHLGPFGITLRTDTIASLPYRIDEGTKLWQLNWVDCV